MVSAESNSARGPIQPQAGPVAPDLPVTSLMAKDWIPSSLLLFSRRKGSVSWTSLNTGLSRLRPPTGQTRSRPAGRTPAIDHSNHWGPWIQSHSERGLTVATTPIWLHPCCLGVCHVSDSPAWQQQGGGTEDVYWCYSGKLPFAFTSTDTLAGS